MQAHDQEDEGQLHLFGSTVEGGLFAGFDAPPGVPLEVVAAAVKMEYPRLVADVEAGALPGIQARDRWYLPLAAARSFVASVRAGTQP